MQKYSKFIKELVEYINDLSINCSTCSEHDLFLCPGICDWYPLYPYDDIAGRHLFFCWLWAKNPPKQPILTM